MCAARWASSRARARSGRSRRSGGRAWTRVREADGAPGQWYLHLFAEQQPDLNWDNEEVRTSFEEILRFWFELGVDGFRIDVAHGLVKAEGLPDVGYPEGDAAMLMAWEHDDHPHWDVDEVHDIYRGWRALAEGYAEERIFVAGGFAEVTAERCTVLAEQALPIGEIDRSAVEADLKDAREDLADAKSDQERAAAEAAIAVAEAKIAAVETTVY